MPKKDSLLGRTLLKAQKKKGRYIATDGFRHSSDLNDGRDFGRLNLNSVTEQTSLDNFLDTAELAESDFVAEMSNVTIVDPNFSSGLLSEEEKTKLKSAQERNKEILSIPRRPHWDLETMTKEEIDTNEKEAFLVWRRKLAFLQEEEHMNLTPFEKNLEIWRQLWRVIERSDVIVQIVDARNPLLFRCLDLEAYVKEVDSKKKNILLLNKADLLNENQRKLWGEYFEKMGMQVVFFSALIEGQKADEELQEVEDEILDFDPEVIKNSPNVLTRENLLAFLKIFSKNRKTEEHVPTAGLVGYPNVGKSSTLNALLMSKKACVSATPGKTKHFQTHVIDEDLILCDCPGLVFPHFVSTKADMVINGILPIDQLTECMQPVSLVTHMIPRRILETTYSILISTPGEGRDSNSKPTAEEFLNAHGYNRGFMTQRGLPDNSRSARYVLKDFVSGKLLYCHAPPGIPQEEFHQFIEVKKKNPPKLLSGDKVLTEPLITDADRHFFSAIHVKGQPSNSQNQNDAKPWKKHNNKNKKEKLRRVYNPYT